MAVSAVTSACRGADLSETGSGVALLNDAKYGHNARENVLRLGLVRGSVYPDPLADEGEQDFARSVRLAAGSTTPGSIEGNKSRCRSSSARRIPTI